MTCEQFKEPTGQDQEEFLINLYFGETRDYLDMCLDRAYRDFNRTLHGIKYHPNIYGSAKNMMVESFREALQNKNELKSSIAFDEWHKKLCTKLCEHYDAKGFEKYHIGQAQKWINMTFKYIFTMGENRLPGYHWLYRTCHIPLDNIIMNKLSIYGLPQLGCPWSRIDNYEKYMELQNWVRDYFKGSAPLAVEFTLFLRKDSSA